MAGNSLYPASIDTFSEAFTDSTPQAAVHAQHHDDLADAVKNVQTELGTDPSYTFATVKDRLNALDQPSFNIQTASYTLVLADYGKIVGMNLAGANNLTVPPNSAQAFPTGTQMTVKQEGAGQTTIVAGAGVTIRSRGGAMKIAGQYGYATLIKVGTDAWDLTGDITV